MTFTRTQAGIENEYLFYRVDFIVYVEGGTSRSIDRVVNGEFDPISDDIRFWNAILQVYLSDNTCKFKAVGSKTTLNQLASQVADSADTRVLVCMDRDFDVHTGACSNHKAVLYTCGYSWENDVWNRDTIEAVYKRFCSGCPIETNVSGEVEAWCQRLRGTLRWGVYADYFLYLRGYRYDTFRKKAKKVIFTEPDGCPCIRRQQLLEELSQIRPRPNAIRSSRVKTRLDPLKDCFGHLLNEIASKFVNFLLQTKCSAKGNRRTEDIVCVAVSELQQLLTAGALPELNQHYAAQFCRFSTPATF